MILSAYGTIQQGIIVVFKLHCICWCVFVALVNSPPANSSYQRQESNQACAICRMTVMLVEGLELYASLSQRGVRGEIRFSGDEEVYRVHIKMPLSILGNTRIFADLSRNFSFIRSCRKHNFMLNIQIRFSKQKEKITKLSISLKKQGALSRSTGKQINMLYINRTL